MTKAFKHLKIGELFRWPNGRPSITYIKDSSNSYRFNGTAAGGWQVSPNAMYYEVLGCPESETGQPRMTRLF